jgi:hypothetical protein
MVTRPINRSLSQPQRHRADVLQAEGFSSDRDTV